MTGTRRRNTLAFASATSVATTVGTLVLMGRRGRGRAPIPAETILVFGAGVVSRGPTPLLQARLDRAAELYAQGYAPSIVCSGGFSGSFSEPAAMSRALQALGVPGAAIRLDERGSSTRRTLAAFEHHHVGVRRVLAVSSRPHMLRVLGEARRQGVDVVPCPACRTPTKGPLRRRARELGREVAAVWWYSLTGWSAKVKKSVG